MTFDWHIQGREIGTKRSKPVAEVRTMDDVGGTRQSPYDHRTLSRVDRTHSLDHTTAVVREQESERQRRLSAATVETFVSVCCGGRLTLSLSQLNCR